MSTPLTLTCPIRGLLKTSAKAKDGLKPTEEYFRVEAIKYLLKKGYPASHFKIEAVVKKFGNSARNSMRADFAVLDCPVTAIASGDVDALLSHAVLLCEVKRENTDNSYVKHTQVKPLLDFAKDEHCLALYWDNVDQRLFWNEKLKTKRSVKEGPLAMLPRYGASIKLKPLAFDDTRPSDSLIDLFDRIENLLHISSIDLDQRFSVMLQLLLTKLYDEHAHAGKPNSELDIQDFEALGYSAPNALKHFNTVLEKAISHYQRYLPKSVDKKLHSKVSGEILLEISKLLAPIRLIASKRDVIQIFYMKFAKGLYKWDLAQFFTPPTVTDFIVNILNPQNLEHIKDPACGSADFLTAAFHMRRDLDKNYADCIWGADNSKNAVQVAVLNMLLNGDGKSNIKEVDSLATVDLEKNQYDIMVCNPPFGVKIVEKNTHTLRQFELGHEWDWDDKTKSFKKPKVDKLLASQETGLLFAEACVIQAKPKGRIGIILPNGYLANRSKKYRLFREWLLCQCRLVAICSFPRFTFKTSGADVSASIVYLEKRNKPITHINKDTKYNFSIQMIENVGWNLGDKKAAPRYLRNIDDGSYIVGEEGERLLDADFSSALSDLRSSKAAKDFPWLTLGIKSSANGIGWSVSINNIIADPDLTIDPKRHCKKFSNLRDDLSSIPHFKMSDVVEFIKEKTSATGVPVKRVGNLDYEYVEIQDIGYGDFTSTSYRGWEMPDRAKHFAEVGDIYIGSIWGSVSKWCLIPTHKTNLVVTNGCHRLRIKPGKEEFLPDVVAFLCAESYAVQMRGLARGSDGLAEVTEDDVASVIIPKLTDDARMQITPYIHNLMSGIPDVKSKIGAMVLSKDIPYAQSNKRPSHVVLV